MMNLLIKPRWMKSIQIADYCPIFFVNYTQYKYTLWIGFNAQQWCHIWVKFRLDLARNVKIMGLVKMVFNYFWLDIFKTIL